MESNVERECSALGGLFQQIVSDMKNGTPLWEDLVVKATKLHSCLRATIHAISIYLEAFQKIADAATNARGAKDIGTALTRVCLRHKAVEARVKSLTSAIMDCLVIPLQDKIEDWKKALVTLDKEHARDYKRARSDLKKRSSDTLRLQKKAKKCSKSVDLHRRVESSLQDFNERMLALEEIEKKAVRSALVEERSRFCLLVAFLKPVVDEEVAMLSELSHLQEVVEQLEKHTSDPHILPAASEQVINDVKNCPEVWTFQTPPSSPGSLGSRKSSMCSISSLNSSSSGSSKSQHSSNHQLWQHGLSQPPGKALGMVSRLGLSSVSSQDSGFTSQDTLFNKSTSLKVSGISEQNSVSSLCSGGALSSAGIGNSPSTWPNLQETLQFERAASAILSDRPHTISSAYETERHQRPALTIHTFHAPESSLSQPASPVPQETSSTVIYSSNTTPKPPVPSRCSSLEGPALPSSKSKIYNRAVQSVLQQAGIEINQLMYVNMHELANLAASKAQEKCPMSSSETKKPNDTPDKKVPSQTSESDDKGLPDKSQDQYRSTYSLDTHITYEEKSHVEAPVYGTLRNTLTRRGSVQGQKPPPPIRRTSSISISGRASLLNSQMSSESSGSLECLPPPPAFLLESTPEPVKCQSLNDVFKKNGNENQRSAALIIAAELERKAAMPTVTEKKSCSDLNQSICSVSVAETVRALTELKHTPASPVSIRRTHSLRSQSADRKPDSGIIATISSKLATGRRFSQEPVSCSKAVRVRQKIATRTLPDPTLCHDSLMDQIKKGTVLKKTRTVNDRSAPRIF